MTARARILAVPAAVALAAAGCVDLTRPTAGDARAPDHAPERAEVPDPSIDGPRDAPPDAPPDAEPIAEGGEPGDLADADSADGEADAPDAPAGEAGDAPERCDAGEAPGCPVACALDSDCAVTHHCADGFCCDQACDGECVSCNQLGSAGHCAAVKGADDPDSCPAGRTCDSTGACRTKLGIWCSAGAECVSGHCRDSVCCDRACDGQCESCIQPGSVGRCGPVTGGGADSDSCAGRCWGTSTAPVCCPAGCWQPSGSGGTCEAGTSGVACGSGGQACQSCGDCAACTAAGACAPLRKGALCCCGCSMCDGAGQCQGSCNQASCCGAGP